MWPRNEQENIHIVNACQTHVFWLVIKLYRMMTGICTDVGFIWVQCTGVCHVWHLHCEEWCLQFWCRDVGASYWAQAFGQVQPSVCLPKLSLNTVANCCLRLGFHVLCWGCVSRAKGIYVWLVKLIRVCVVFDSWSTTLCWISSVKLATWNLVTLELCIMYCHHTPGKFKSSWKKLPHFVMA